MSNKADKLIFRNWKFIRNYYLDIIAVKSAHVINK